MLHHLSLGVSDVARAAAFYDRALAPLGYVRVWTDLRPGERGQAVGYGLAGGGDKLALKQAGVAVGAPYPGFHLAFAAPSRESVAAFHAAALAAGGKDNGAPGLRDDYGPNYLLRCTPRVASRCTPGDVRRPPRRPPAASVTVPFRARP